MFETGKTRKIIQIEIHGTINAEYATTKKWDILIEKWEVVRKAGF